ncbi:MAG TPA: hypothetical protein VKT77_03510, partial [Chthonomonadaceae bacterium]|nr:hypothetical protein [Chthonomonadaceae bacterium]
MLVHAGSVAGLLLVSMAVAGASRPGGQAPRGFQQAPWYGELRLEERTPDGVRVVWNLPAGFDPARPTLLTLYATPNGNTAEQTLGAAPTRRTDWHFDIQHIAAQIRTLRALDRRENIVLACVEAEGLSWPAWRAKHADSPALIAAFVQSAVARFPGPSTRVALAAHSGGGSFVWGYLNSAEAIPDSVARIALLDANYSYASADGHGDKLSAWLQRSPVHRLVVLCYDDRNITLDGKPVVGPTGGTYRATHRMLDDFGKPFEIKRDADGPFDRFSADNGRALFIVHRNPDNRILHTALVGEMNGLLMALTAGTPEAGLWGALGGPRAYTEWIQPSPPDPVLTRESLPGLPDRPHDAGGGAAVMARVAALPLEEREAQIEREIDAGNVPDFLRAFRPITVTGLGPSGAAHTIVFEAAPDYLSVGSDADFVRVPLTPMTAGQIAERYACVLPTRKMVDAIYRAAELKLEPRPMTADRESVATFLQHNAIVEEQRRGKP